MASKSDSVPTWDLMLEAQSTVELLTRQPRDQGQWLGQVIAAWAERSCASNTPEHRAPT